MKGICFKEPLFNAIIEEKKTQTRRIMNPQPNTCGSCYEYTDSDCKYIGGGKFCYVKVEKVDANNEKCVRYEEDINPRYKVGEKAYLKEPYHIDNDGFVYYNYRPHLVMDYEPLNWLNKLFMPAKYARYFIEITDVRYERLQDISDEDCFKEGIIKHESNYDFVNNKYEDTGRVIKCMYSYTKGYGTLLYDTPSEAYAALIDQISGKGTWGTDPYVWVYEFKLVNNFKTKINHGNGNQIIQRQSHLQSIR
jgi:hypothetical protein